MLNRLFNPQILLLLLLGSLPFDRIPSLDVFGATIRPSVIIALFLIILVLKDLDGLKWVLKDAFYRLMAGFLLVSLVSALLSSYPLLGLKTAVYYLFVVLLSIAVAQVVRKASFGERQLRWLLGGAVISCLFGMWQFFGDVAGLPAALTGLKSAYQGSVFGFPRIQSTALEPLYYANYLLLPLAALLTRHKLSKAGSLTVVLVFSVLLLTLSRGGVAAGIVVVLGAILFEIKNSYFKRAFKLGGLVILSVAAVFTAIAVVVPAVSTLSRADLALSTFQNQITDYEIGDTTVDRAETRRLATTLFTREPWLGVGPGLFGEEAGQILPKYPPEQIVNNEYLELLAEIGVLGFVLIAGAGITVFWRAGKFLFDNSIDEGQRRWVFGLLLFLLATAVQYWSFSTLYIIHLWAALGLLLGQVVRQSENARVGV